MIEYQYMSGNTEKITPRNILSLRPTDSIISRVQQNRCDTVHLYVDLKNVLRSLYHKDVCNQLLHDQELIGSSSLIFQSILILYSDWKELCNKHNLDLKMFVFSDTNRSVYHLNIDRGYKCNRRITTSSMLSEDILEIRRKNTELGYNIYNKLPNIYMFYLRALEADFVPYWLITRKFKEQENVFHVIFSNDKDMFQVLTSPRIIQVYKVGGGIIELDTTNVSYKYYKIDTTDFKKINKINPILNNIKNEYLIVSMALCGDASDDVAGLPRIAEKTALRIVCDSDLVNLIIGSPEELYDRIISDNPFFKDNVNWECLSSTCKPLYTVYKNIGLEKINEICTKSYKLISFECLCNWLEKCDTTEKIDLVKEIEKVLDKANSALIPNSKIFMESMRSLRDCSITENEVDNIFL